MLGSAIRVLSSDLAFWDFFGRQVHEERNPPWIVYKNGPMKRTSDFRRPSKAYKKKKNKQQKASRRANRG